MSARPLLDALGAALEAGRRGDAAGCEALAREIERGRVPLATDEARAAAVEVWSMLARHAALALDGAAVAALGRKIESIGAPPAVRAAAELVSAWRALLSDDAGTALARVSDAAAHAADHKAPDLVVECAALGALARLASSGDLDGAVKAARRASRMARTEGIPLSEALAHLVLARARRRSGHAHLALRIIRGLWMLPTTAHRSWLAVEQALAGGARHPAPVDGALAELAAALDAMVAAAESGSLDAFDAATALLERRAAVAPAFLRDEIRALAIGCDARRDPRGTPLEPFLLGAVTEIPAALHGISTSRGVVPEAESAIVYVVAVPGGARRRIMRLGRALSAPSATALRQTRRRNGRAETVLATLLLADPEGLDEAECFRASYGFAFIPEVHRGALDVALHRARDIVGDGAVLERQGSRIRLTLRSVLLCPDPRCSQQIADRILAALAEHGAQGAKELAESIGAPLRVAQAALSALVEDGVCEARRSGRALEYHLEDTTFSEPTYAR
jgi:hypothetical protein